MKTLCIHLRHAILPATFMAAAFFSVPFQASAQKAQSRLKPLIAHPSAEPIGPSLRLNDERIDLSTITREDKSLRVGRELVQGETITTVRRKSSSGSGNIERERRQKVIREQDELRHKRLSVIYDD